MANLDKSRFFLRDWFVVHVKCTFEHTFPGNVIASALHHGAKCKKNK